MIRLVPVLLLVVAPSAFAGPIGEDTPQGTNATATVNLSATLDTSTSIWITGRNGDPFAAESGSTGNVSFGAVNLATGTTTAEQSTGFVIHSDASGPDADSITLWVELNLDATVTGVASGQIMIRGSSPASPSEARYTCSPGPGVWGSATTYNANSPLQTTDIECAPLVTGLNPIDADFALHIPTTENAASVTATFIVTVIPGA